MMADILSHIFKPTNATQLTEAMTKSSDLVANKKKNENLDWLWFILAVQKDP